MATAIISPIRMLMTIGIYGKPDILLTHMDTIKLFRIIGGKTASILFGILLVIIAAIRVTRLPPMISIGPKPPNIFEIAQPTVIPNIAEGSTRGSIARASDTLNWIGP